MAEPQVVLIAGASSEIGQAAGQLLAQQGYRVFGTGRQPAGIEMLPLDVTADDSVAACVAAVLQRAGRVDALINLVSYVVKGALEEVSLAEAKALFETNFFGMLRPVNAVLPAVRQQRRGRIINVSALSGIVAEAFGRILASRRPRIRYQVGPGSTMLAVMRRMMPDTTLQRMLGV